MSPRSWRMATALVVAALLTMLTACGTVTQNASEPKPVVKPGRGMFTYDGYEPLADHRPLTDL